MTLTDVTEFKAANERLEFESERLSLAWEAARGAIYEHAVPLDRERRKSRPRSPSLGRAAPGHPHP